MKVGSIDLLGYVRAIKIDTVSKKSCEWIHDLDSWLLFHNILFIVLKLLLKLSKICKILRKNLKILSSAGSNPTTCSTKIYTFGLSLSVIGDP